MAVTKAALLAVVAFYQAEPPGLARRCRVSFTLINVGMLSKNGGSRNICES